MWMLLLAAACVPNLPEDTGEDTEVVDSGNGGTTGYTCDAVEIRVDGEDPPTVGDQWSILLWCDDTLLTGAMVVRFDPPEVARLDENEATFIEPGDAKLYVQVGRHNASRAVSIADD